MASIEIRTCDRLAEIPAAQWDALHGGANPFLHHAFLSGLEDCECLGEQGWYPLHLVAWQDDSVVAALPLYLRDNSYGEFVFDWNWAEAYERSGRDYYPKLVTAVPFTPATGPRLLLGSDAQGLAGPLIEAAVTLVKQTGASSYHCLFPTDDQIGQFTDAGLLQREGCQYHWFNHGYSTFDDFLAALNAKRRKQIKRERREVAAQGLTLEVRHGDEISDDLWAIYYEFYCSTFHRRWGAPRLTLKFFRYLGKAMPRQTLLFLARDGDEYVAGAFAMRGHDTLFGRHWGCSDHYPFLHFELCYYQTIDYCIRNGLTRLDAGAQGEHKIPRGFEAVATHSAHYIADRQFRAAIADFLRRETTMVDHRIEAIGRHSPYRIEQDTRDATERDTDV